MTVIPILRSSNIRREEDTIMKKDIRGKESDGFYAYVPHTRRICTHTHTHTHTRNEITHKDDTLVRKRIVLHGRCFYHTRVRLTLHICTRIYCIHCAKKLVERLQLPFQLSDETILIFVTLLLPLSFVSNVALRTLSIIA